MSEPKEALVKVIAILLSLFVLWALRRASWARREPLRERLLDILTSLLLCAASLATGRVKLAGGLLAYAACSRVFPVIHTHSADRLCRVSLARRKGTRNSICARICRRRLRAGRLRLHRRTRRGRVARIGTAPVAPRRCNGAQRCWTYGPIQFESQQYARRTCRSVELVCLYADFS